MRKTLMLGTLFALSGAGALAQARDVTAPEQKSPIEASQPAAAVRGEENGRERRAASDTERRASRDDRHKHHGEARERHDEHEQRGQRR